MTDTKMADSQHLEAAEGKVLEDSSTIVVSEKMSSQVKKKASANYNLIGLLVLTHFCSLIDISFRLSAFSTCYHISIAETLAMRKQLGHRTTLV